MPNRYHQYSPAAKSALQALAAKSPRDFREALAKLRTATRAFNSVRRTKEARRPVKGLLAVIHQQATDLLASLIAIEQAPQSTFHGVDAHDMEALVRSLTVLLVETDRFAVSINSGRGRRNIHDIFSLVDAIRQVYIDHTSHNTRGVTTNAYSERRQRYGGHLLDFTMKCLSVVAPGEGLSRQTIADFLRRTEPSGSITAQGV